MLNFSLPGWIKPHLYPGKNFSDLSDVELLGLKSKISHFNADNPDVSVVIPAWNEENNIFRTLSSIASNTTLLKVELIVINNNSTDNTQQVLDTLGVKTYFERNQGINFSRQEGLKRAKGKFHLCADSDTFYPPVWIDMMTQPMIADARIVGVYGRYAFIPPDNSGRFGLWMYEIITGLLVHLRKRKMEFLNVLGFNMGFVARAGLQTDGFQVSQTRKFGNSKDSEDYTVVSEDGAMALKLKTQGNLKLITNPQSRVFTSSRKLLQDGSIGNAFWNRVKIHTGSMHEYLFGKKVIS